MEEFPTGSRPAWLNGARPLLRRPLDADAQADVCVIGAGIAGMWCAYEFARAGARVAVIDDGPIGGGDTGRTTAHLTHAIDDRFYRIERAMGAQTARVCAESHTAAIAAYARVATLEGIECDFAPADGYLFLPPGGSVSILEEELAAARRAGIVGVELIDSAPSFASGPCIRFPSQGQVHPLKFLAGLADAIERHAARIFTGTHVASIIEETGSLRVTTADHLTVGAPTVIVATNSPFNDRVTMHTKQSACRTYAIAAKIAPGIVPPALFWDTSQSADDPDGPYHYVRTAGLGTNGRESVLIVGGEDHHTGDDPHSDERWASLEAWARVRWPIGEVLDRWSGQVMEPHDGVAFIGPNPTGPRGVYIVTGDSGMGMTHGAIAGLIIPDLVAGRANPWAATYDPARKPLHDLGRYAREAARVAARYADWVAPAESAENIAPGEGGVIRHGVRLLAVYRDRAGTLHARSAVCPHLGCIVRWNSAERSWDCPCHGSRFDAHGTVINGPASTDLPHAPAPDPAHQPGAR